ncbi:C-type lectin-related protein 4 [Elysia marginata]|uniref:C-type lectin-related protein 4 n=1 Tax=Elysia marginata TaxID=1093978 RepID=A0AAV4FUS7_9GAST|nr:C-type lectin-related protein 4 [Elysia marginata]
MNTFLLSFTKEYTFTQEPTAILSSNSYRLADTRWLGVASGVSCALKVVLSCQGSRGCIYEAGSGQCTPLLWLHKGSGQASSKVPAGALVLTTDHLCPDLFQAIEYGSNRQVACVLKIAPPTNYTIATSQCHSLGGYLASVKTPEKLAMVANFANGADLWVGIDDRVVEGRFIWQEDSSVLTDAVKNAVFAPGQPNNAEGREDCIHYMASRDALNDQHCWDTAYALCEIPLLNPQC